MSKHDRRKQRKQKKRERRIRQEKHARVSGSGWARDSAWDDEFAPPPFFGTERTLRTLVWLTGLRTFANQSELEVFTREQCSGETGKDSHARMVREAPVEQAQELAFRAMEVAARDPEAALALARLAVSADPDCLDAIVLLAQRGTDDDDERFRTIADAIERVRGISRFASVLERDGHAWNRVHARPFLRALVSAATWAMVTGRQDPALSYADEIEALDAAYAGAMWDMRVGWLLGAGKLPAAQALLDRHRDEDLPLWLWAAALERFLVDDRSGARRFVDAARAHVDGFEAALVAAIEPEDSRNLQHIMISIGRAWQAHDTAMAWMEEGCLLTTADERAAAIRSYAAAVAALLNMGEPVPGRRNAEQAIQVTGLGVADIPELLRMIDDQGLHDLMPEDTAASAPEHAARALALLATPEALTPLLAIVERRVHDRRLFGWLRVGVARLGEPALAAMTKWLGEGHRAVRERIFAAETLGDIGEAGHRSEAVSILQMELGWYRLLPPRLNEAIIWSLVQLRAVEAEDLIRVVYQSGLVDAEEIVPWEDVREELHDLSGRGSEN